MLSSEIEKYLKSLNQILERKNIKGEIGIVEGAAMCLAFHVRASTKDVDPIFEPSSAIRAAATDVAHEFDLSPDWLNDAVKGFMKPIAKKKILFEFPNLSVWTPEADYLLAMKSISARWDTSDQDDIIFLIKFLELKSASEVFSIIETYYPKSQIPPKTQFFIEEIFETP